MCIALQQTLRTHQLARCTESALRRIMIDERLLQWIELSVLREAFDGLYRAAIGPGGEIAA